MFLNCSVLNVCVIYNLYVLRVIDNCILDDDGILHSTDSTVGVGSRTISVASPVASSSWIPFIGLFFVIC